MESIEINGIKYRQNEKQVSKKMSKTMTMLYGMALMMGGSYGKEKERPEVDIVSEFALIQEKKSNLSANDRKWVESQFYRNFTEIEENKL